MINEVITEQALGTHTEDNFPQLQMMVSKDRTINPWPPGSSFFLTCLT